MLKILDVLPTCTYIVGGEDAYPTVQLALQPVAVHLTSDEGGVALVEAPCDQMNMVKNAGEGFTANWRHRRDDDTVTSVP